MKIALATIEENLNSKLDQTFGRAETFCIYDTESHKETFLDNPARNASGGAGIKSAQTIVDLKADILIAFRLGENALKVLEGANITTYKAVDKSAKENIDLYLNNELTKLADIHPGYHH